MDIPPAHFQTPFTVQITTNLLSTLLALSTGDHGWKPDKDG
jgi:hypothetical protein